MPSEKEERIKRMLRQEKTWDTIMKELHVGPGRVKKAQEAMIRSEVFELLENNCPLHEVSSKLDISSDKVKKYQLEYLELKGQDKLVSLLKDKDISNLIPVARQIKARNLTPEQIEIGLNLSISVRQLENKRRELSDSISLERKKYAQLCEQRSTTEDEINKLMKQKGRLLENTELLQARLTVFRLAIEKLRNSKDITNLQEIVKNIATSLLDDNKILLAAALSAICRIMAANPQCMTLFSDPAATETLAFFILDPGPPGNQSWISKTANSIFEANIVILMNGILLGTINVLGNKKFETEFEKVKAEMAQFMMLRKHHPLITSMFEN
jgi:hypothetical protein